MDRVQGLVVLAGVALSVTGSALGAQPAGNDEVRAVVAEMLADAETRSSLLAGGDAGHDGRFFIAGDGFRLNIGGMEQFRYVANFRDDSNVDQDQFGFQNRRTQLWFEGKINKDWDFRVMGEFSDVDTPGSSGSGTFSLQDAWVRYNFANGLKLTWGQFKLPLLREEMINDGKLLAADRSLTNDVFSQFRSQGVMLSYQADAWRAAVAFSDGLNSRNTDFTGSDENTAAFPVSGEADWAATGRFEFMLAGNWGMFDDFTATKGQDFGALIGVAGHYQQSPNTNRFSDTDRDTFEYTGDLSLEGDSWNVFGAFIGRYTKLRTAGSETTFNDFGAVVQAGWRFAENTEVFGRWDAIFPDNDRPFFAEDTYHFLTAGINHYFAGHAAKATIDVVYAFQQTRPDFNGVSALPNTGVGLLGDVEDGEFTIRAQFQLIF